MSDLNESGNIIQLTSKRRWRINGDGTITDQNNFLMWMQVPLGMNQNGTEKPVMLTWVEAKNLYGMGNFAGDEGERISIKN